jgi:hypothetical protein
MSNPTNRTYLKRALKLGFSRMQLFSSESPVVCRQQDEQSPYLWMPLSGRAGLEATNETTRIHSDPSPAESLTVQGRSTTGLKDESIRSADIATCFVPVDLASTAARFHSLCLIHLVLVGGALRFDLFRLPFVFSREWDLSSVVPPMNLFKVFPRFGAMIVAEPIEQQSYSLAAHLMGWTYHFSNGVTFGVMYVAMIGDPRRRSWLWAVLMATGLELAMVLTPYPQFFAIPVTLFVAVTFMAHIVFGVVLGAVAKWWPNQPLPTA